MSLSGAARGLRRRCGAGALTAATRLLLGGGGLLLRGLLGLLGGEPRLLGGLGVGLGLGLRVLLRTLGGKPRRSCSACLRLFGRRHMGFFGHDLVELKLGEARIETVGMLGEEGVERALVADLQRQFIVAADVGLRIGAARCRRCRGRGAAWAGTSGTSSPPSEP